jgi:gliding motility-associated-like protein
MKKFSLFVFSFAFALVSFGQTFSTDNTTPPYNNITTLIPTVLAGGSNTTILNPSYSPTNANVWNRIGYFSDSEIANPVVGFPTGLVISTGGLTAITGGASGTSIGPNDTSLLNTLASVGVTNYNVNNTTIIEFDFIAPADYIEFYYVFASKEYNTWTCGPYYDIFGFYLSGPDPNSPLVNYSEFNMARIPTDLTQTSFTSTPIMVNTINAGTPSPGYVNNPSCPNVNPNYTADAIFFIPNPTPNAPYFNFNGYTIPLRAYAPVVCDSTYHMKLAAADGGDAAVQMAVFIQENSFRGPVNLTFEDSTNVVPPGDTSGYYYEGCGTVSITFKRPPDWDFAPGTGDLPIYFDLMGTADHYDDYVFMNNPYDDHFIIPNWDSVFTLQLQINQDFIQENTEEIILRIYHLAGASCHDDGFLDFTFTISDYEFVETELVDKITSHCPGDEVNFEVEIDGGIPDLLNGDEVYDLHWSQIGYAPEQTVYPEESTWYYVYVKDMCPQYVVIDSVFVEVLQWEELEVRDIPDIYLCEDTEVEVSYPIDSVTGGDGDYTYKWVDLATGATIAWGEKAVLRAGLYQLEITDGCDSRDFMEMEVFHYEVPETDIVITEMPVELRYKFSGYEVPNNPNVPYMTMKYIWDFGDGSPLFYGKVGVHDYATYGDYVVSLTMENEQECVKLFEKPLNLRPTYFAPTIFTPNGDGINEGFAVTTTRKHEEFKMRIYDRWGQEVFATEDINDPWFGYYKDGQMAQAGTYVYKVEIKYLNLEDVYETNGVFTLNR